MRSVEEELFHTVATALRTQFTGIFVTGEAVYAPPQFPCVCFYEDDNYTTQDALDSSGTERFCTLRYRIDVYSDKAGGRKGEVKDILAVIEPILYARNFTRDSRAPMSDMGDQIYHVVETCRVITDGTAFYRV